jgi:RNA polymerase sigma-70 factor, ECF subfamily
MVWEIGLPLRFAASLPDNPTDAELVDECKRGNLRAFERLYTLHSPKMKSLAFRMLGSRADAEDVVQEAFLKVYKAVPGFDGQSAISTWMFRILINCCYDLMRRQQRQAEAPLLQEVAGDSKPALKIALERALSQLNERPRLVFLMFEVEGLRHSEIAAILQVPEGTSRSWLFEAKRELKRLLTESRT